MSHFLHFVYEKKYIINTSCIVLNVIWFKYITNICVLIVLYIITVIKHIMYHSKLYLPGYLYFSSNYSSDWEENSDISDKTNAHPLGQQGRMHWAERPNSLSPYQGYYDNVQSQEKRFQLHRQQSRQENGAGAMVCATFYICVIVMTIVIYS